MPIRHVPFLLMESTAISCKYTCFWPTYRCCKGKVVSLTACIGGLPCNLHFACSHAHLCTIVHYVIMQI